jgi:hypothetical protein
MTAAWNALAARVGGISSPSHAKGMHLKSNSPSPEHFPEYGGMPERRPAPQIDHPRDLRGPPTLTGTSRRSSAFRVSSTIEPCTGKGCHDAAP